MAWRWIMWFLLCEKTGVSSENHICGWATLAIKHGWEADQLPLLYPDICCCCSIQAA